MKQSLDYAAFLNHLAWVVDRPIADVPPGQRIGELGLDSVELLAALIGVEAMAPGFELPVSIDGLLDLTLGELYGFYRSYVA